jgi:oligopeptidase A
MGQNRALFQAYRSAGQQPGSRRFRRGAKNHSRTRPARFPPVGYRPAGRAEALRRSAEQLSELGSRFSNQLLDATQAWTKHITDEAALAGLTDSAKAQMAAAARPKASMAG